MLQTRRGCEDGFSSRLYEKGNIYDVRDNLAASFNSCGYSEPADVIYYQIKWIKTGRVTRQPLTLAIKHYLARGIVQLVEV
jgi:hypothetical protein